MTKLRLFLLLTATGLMYYCGNSEEENNIEETENTLSAAFEEFDSDNVTVTLEGDEVIIETNGYPNHTSPYWPESNSLYVTSSDPDFNENKAPGTINQYVGTTTLTVPVNPSKASGTTATNLGPIGIAVSGAVIYDDQEGPNVPLTFPTAYSLDYTGAHTGPMSYHYHVEPIAWSEDDNKLIGIMSDGFFLYGRKCASTGTYPSDLDASGGHTATTQHSDEALYHYHIQNEIYLNTFYLLFPGEFQGTPNAISQ